VSLKDITAKTIFIPILEFDTHVINVRSKKVMQHKTYFILRYFAMLFIWGLNPFLVAIFNVALNIYYNIIHIPCF
jgi:hypothetical protein